MSWKLSAPPHVGGPPKKTAFLCVLFSALLRRLLWEEKNVIRNESRWAGGKGINVARWLEFFAGQNGSNRIRMPAGAAASNPRPHLLIPLGGAPGKEMADGMRAEGLDFTSVPLREPSRVNVVVTTARDGQIRFNQPGPDLSRCEWRDVQLRTKKLLVDSSCLVLSGSLPGGVPSGAYADLISLAHRRGIKSALDCDGATLRSAVKARPFLVKPNEHELAEWAGRDLRSENSVINAGRTLSAATGGWILISRGAEGALLVNQIDGTVCRARPPRVKPLTTVGAGDALLAAAVSQMDRGAPPVEWLRLGVAAGAAATQCRAGKLPTRSLIRRFLKEVKVDEVS
jgi:1-phosphofructokinase family hexose kinase